jgi:hypothetical protein
MIMMHITEATDVSHTMQHVYQDWNQRLLEEMYIAYRLRRAERDPLTHLYEVQLLFY